MVQVTKIGYAGFNTTHMEAMLAYYTEVIGFTLEERGGDGAAYLSNALDHHCIALYPSRSQCTTARSRHRGRDANRRSAWHTCTVTIARSRRHYGSTVCHYATGKA